MTDATKALIYCRVSSTRQATEGHGLDSQELRCRQYALSMGYDVEAVFPDDVSGGGDFMKRPGLVALLRHLDARKGASYVVIFDDLKRFARDTEFHIRLRQAFKKRKAKIECLNFKFEDTPEGKFVETILAAQGELEREQNSRQVSQKMQARVEAGYWCFYPPLGYMYQNVAGHGKMLMRDEPLASIIAEGLTGYASGRFETQAELQRFLQSHAAYPKNSNGEVHSQRVIDLIGQPLYAGRITVKKWNIVLQPGQHEPLIPLETWQAIQGRENYVAKAPAKSNLSDDFPMRGFLTCGDCGKAMTSCWSKGRSALYPYYLCDTRGCVSYRKSVRKEKVEAEFEALLKGLQPSEGLFNLAFQMFRDLWDAKLAGVQGQAASMRKELTDIGRKIDQLLDRIVEATGDAVVAAYEKKIADLGMQKAILSEKIANSGKPVATFGETYRTAFEFLANPYKLWLSPHLEDRRAVLRLVFADRLHYQRGFGYRTAQLSMPFKMLGDMKMQKSEMVELSGIEPLTSSLRTTRSPN